MTAQLASRHAAAGVPASPHALMLREELRERSMRRIGELTLRDLRIEVAVGRDSLWALVRRERRGGTSGSCPGSRAL